MWPRIAASDRKSEPTNVKSERQMSEISFLRGFLASTSEEG